MLYLLLFVSQVTRKFSALFIQALQQPDSLPAMQLLAANTMALWLHKALPSVSASPRSRAAATVRQQLQDLQLLQHLALHMDAAAARLTAAATALTGTPTMQKGTARVDRTADYMNAESFCKGLLQIFQLASCVLSSTGMFSILAALPAAPAAVRITLSVFQVCRSPLPASPGALHAALLATVALVAALQDDDDVPDGTLQSCPAASELLQMPEFGSCLAIASVAATLGLDVSGDDAARGAASSDSDGGSSTGREVLGAGGPQQPAQQAGSHKGAASRSSSSSGPGNGVRLDSLTPLSCSLFDILGVTKETALQLAGLAKEEGFNTPAPLQKVLEIYSCVLEYQVSVSHAAQRVWRVEHHIMSCRMLHHICMLHQAGMVLHT
jgi:hypothetical protein